MKDTKAIGSDLIDSSVWIAYFFEGSHKEIIESEKILYISVLSLFEIKKFLLKKSISEKVINEKIKFLKEKSIIHFIDTKIAEYAAEISLKNNLPAIDSLIYSTAVRNEETFITRDNDFRGLNSVELIE